MDSWVLARRENTGGAYFGFQEDNEILECGRCKNAQYRLRFTENEKGRLEAHHREARRLIENEHPKHSVEIRVL